MMFPRHIRSDMPSATMIMVCWAQTISPRDSSRHSSLFSAAPTSISSPAVATTRLLSPAVSISGFLVLEKAHVPPSELVCAIKDTQATAAAMCVQVGLATPAVCTADASFSRGRLRCESTYSLEFSSRNPNHLSQMRMRCWVCRF